MKLDVAPLTQVIFQLEKGLVRYQSDTTDMQIRDGLIHRFKITYELSHKMLKRFMKETSKNSAEFDRAGFQYLVCCGNQQGLLRGDWSSWCFYRDKRAKAARAYDERVAYELISAIPAFLQETQYLNQQLQLRLGL